MISIDFSADRRLILNTNYLQEGQKAVYGCTAHIGIYQVYGHIPYRYILGIQAQPTQVYTRCMCTAHVGIYMAYVKVHIGIYQVYVNSPYRHILGICAQPMQAHVGIYQVYRHSIYGLGTYRRYAFQNRSQPSECLFLLSESFLFIASGHWASRARETEIYDCRSSEEPHFHFSGDL